MTTTTEATGRMQTHTVAGGGGLQLHVREWGKADGPPAYAARFEAQQ